MENNLKSPLIIEDSQTTKTMGSEKGSSEEKKTRQWAVGLYDCWSYKDIKGKSKFFPNFCPTACLCGNMLIGRIISRQMNEQPRNCCDLGCIGCCVCLSMAIFDAPVPVGANLIQVGVFSCVSLALRESVKTRYNVEETEYPPCCPNNGCTCINMTYLALNYPCSLFQVYESLLYWEAVEKGEIDTNKPANVELSNNDVHIQVNPVLQQPK